MITRLPLPLIFGAVLMAGCVHNSGNPTGPGLTEEKGMGRIACSMMSGPSNGTGSYEAIIDSTGAIIQNIQSRLTPALQGGAGWSSGNGRFVWIAEDSSDPGGLAEVVVSDNSGITNTPIFETHNDTLLFPPSISADGSRVAIVTRYGSPPSYMEYMKLTVMTLEESGDSIRAVDQNVITTFLPRNASIALSPDGSQAAFDDTTGNLVVVSTDGSEDSKIITSLRGADGWYLNGWTIDWSSKNELALGSGGIIRVVSAEGGNLTVVDSGSGYPKWSPDGAMLAYSSMSDDILVTSDLGKTKTNLTNDAQGNGAPSWSPDGNKIAYTSNMGSFFGQPGPSPSVISVSLANGAKHTLLSHAALGVWLR
jgi:hypothetical protein